LQLYGNRRSLSEVHWFGETEHSAVVLAELRVHGPTGIRLVIERTRDGKIALVLLEIGLSLHHLHLLGGAAARGRGENADTTQADVPVVGAARSALLHGGVRECFEAKTGNAAQDRRTDERIFVVVAIVAFDEVRAVLEFLESGAGL